LTQLSIDGKYHKEDVMYLSYRYGFNNMEKDDELKGLGNSYDFGARIYDPRVGRWLAVDPLAGKYPDLSPYIFVANSPLIFVDPDGRKIKVTVVYENNEPVVKVTVSGKIIDLSKTWPIDIEGIAENLNEYGSKYFDREMDVSNINFGTKNDPLYLTGNVKVDITFAFEC
jgi:RHS repeat-associated protein